jgi:hypothetical protein
MSFELSHRRERAADAAAGEHAAEPPPVQVSGVPVAGLLRSRSTQASSLAGTTEPRSGGLPDRLRTGIEALSGVAMDDVRVHRDSTRPSALHALAYTQGRDIYLGSGREGDLPHEAWHVAQQARGRVPGGRTLSSGTEINSDPVLEHEADVMGRRALDTPAAARLDPSVLARVRPQRVVVQANGVRDAFLAGAQVIMAGETHGRFDKALERQIWAAYGIDLIHESDVIQVRPVVGAVFAVRLDTAFMSVLSCAANIRLLLRDHLADWMRDTRQLFVDEINLYADTLIDQVAVVRQEVAADERLRPFLQCALVVQGFVDGLRASVRTYHQANGFERQLGFVSIDKEIRANVDAVRVTIGEGLRLDGLPADLVDRPAYFRSVKMIDRLTGYVHNVPRMTIWKVGENHIGDVEGLGRAANPLIRLMHEDEYAPAFISLEQHLRQQHTQAFLNQLTPDQRLQAEQRVGEFHH